MRQQPRRFGIVPLAVIVVLFVAAGGWFLRQRLEGRPPVVELAGQPLMVGERASVRVPLADGKSGLKRVRVTLTAGRHTRVLVDRRFPAAGWLRGGRLHTTELAVDLVPRELKVPDGPASLSVTAGDYSWRGWGRGNEVTRELPLTIDTRPPGVTVLSRFHNLSQGGSGLAVYQLSEACPRSGVMVGERFYPGFAAPDGAEGIHLAFFALGYDQDTDTPIWLKAVDPAGNEGRGGMPVHLRDTRFRRDTLTVGDGFLDRKLPELVGENAGQDPLERFLDVNRRVRRENNAVITAACARSDARRHWRGAFLRLPGSARRASFADHRVYRYRGREVDRQVHMGIDLASLSHAEVPAANTGRVTLCEPIGIYGNTVIIDHGMGVFSLYAHLSRIMVSRDQMVDRGDIIGLTGQTGLAGGDHLHYGMLVHQTYVDPVEWWDAQWIDHNVTTKLELAAAAP